MLPVALLIVACGGPATPDAPAAPAEPVTQASAAEPAPATTSTEPVPPAAAASTPSSSLPDLTVGLETGSCGNGPGNEGADSHFVGSFTIDGTQVRGTERWLLHANSKLMASKLWTAGQDCEVRWMMHGTTTAPLHCGDCDLGLQLTATVDMTGSTCPEDMVKREKSFEVRYDVRRQSDGVAYVYFAKSARLLGQGYHQGGQLAYVTQHQCKWF